MPKFSDSIIITGPSFRDLCISVTRTFYQTCNYRRQLVRPSRYVHMTLHEGCCVRQRRVHLYERWTNGMVLLRILERFTIRYWCNSIPRGIEATFISRRSIVIAPCYRTGTARSPTVLVIYTGVYRCSPFQSNRRRFETMEHTYSHHWMKMDISRLQPRT